jgi:hypothetical protein
MPRRRPRRSPRSPTMPSTHTRPPIDCSSPSGGGAARDDRAGLRRRRRADGPRHRPGPRIDRVRGRPVRTRARAGRGRQGPDRGQPGTVGREGAHHRRGEGRRARTCCSDRPARCGGARGPRRRGRLRGHRGQVASLGGARCGRPAAGDLRHEHELDLDRPPCAGGGRGSTATLRRRPFLQPGAGDAAHRAHPRDGDGRRDGRGRTPKASGPRRTSTSAPASA